MPPRERVPPPSGRSATRSVGHQMHSGRRVSLIQPLDISSRYLHPIKCQIAYRFQRNEPRARDHTSGPATISPSRSIPQRAARYRTCLTPHHNDVEYCVARARRPRATTRASHHPKPVQSAPPAAVATETRLPGGRIYFTSSRKRAAQVSAYNEHVDKNTPRRKFRSAAKPAPPVAQQQWEIRRGAFSSSTQQARPTLNAAGNARSG
ncbi:hypothetical protein CERZMDRAFT_89278 [Cercospora zeae-maydis SCOH1-5]|uniref:Uncharacterized protein n=1 Tax=Cercospora zeae-maydis SCOH1-5 TaxID=717836 RepID=A0A6A6EXI5_9PEZI|nr:hypothetical protein CERZMDRAFT_89278 [Cercospora zeae-maydis SCOH1-5]